MTVRWPDLLPCGHGFDELILQVADGIDGDLRHQDQCDHCQEVLTALHELWDAVDQVARERVRGPASIDAAALRRVRRELFVARAVVIFGGILPRLSRALLIYAGIIQEDRP